MKLAISAISYIDKRDGISVYIENLLLAVVSEFSKKSEKSIIVVFACGPGAQVLKAIYERKTCATKAGNVDVQFVVYQENNWYVKCIKVPYALWKHGPFDYIVLPNIQPLITIGNPTLSVLHDLTYKIAPNHFSPTRKLYFEVLMQFRMKADSALGYISQATKRDLQRYYPKCIQKPLVYLPNGIPGKVLENPRLPRERIEQKLLSSKIELLFVGRINRLKGFDLVKEIVTFLDHKFSELAIPSTALHVVGKITSEGRRLLENWQCKNVEVNVYGHIEDTQLNELYQRCAFCLFLSRNEGFGLPVIESVWFGCVPVLSKIAIFEELMGDDFSFFVHNDDIGSRVYHFMMRLRYDEEFRRGILDIMERALDKHEKGYQAAASIVAELCREKWQWDSLPDDRLDNGSRSERAPFVTVGGQGGRGQNLEKYEC